MYLFLHLLLVALKESVVTAFAVIQPSTLDQVESLGCWRDAANRAITSLEGLHPLLRDDFRKRLDPVKRCAVVAQERGYNIFALQNGGHCMGDPNMNFDRYGPSNLCRDGRGGIWANSVYSYRTSFQRSNTGSGGRGLKIRHCQKPLDIALLLDGSGPSDSYDLFRWDRMLSFAKDVLQGFDVDDMHSAVLTYGGIPKVIIDMNEESQQLNYVTSLSNTSFPGGTRSLNDALKLAWKEQFKLSPRIANKVILALITGDLASGLTGSSLFLSKKGVRVIAIGIDEDAHYRFLQTVASGRFPRNIFSLSSTQLQEAAPYVVQEVCRVAKWKGRKPRKKGIPNFDANKTKVEEYNISLDAGATKKYLAPPVIVEGAKTSPSGKEVKTTEIQEVSNQDKGFLESKIYKANARNRLKPHYQNLSSPRHRNLPYFNTHRKNLTNMEIVNNLELGGTLTQKSRMHSVSNATTKANEENEMEKIQQLVASALGNTSLIPASNAHDNNPVAQPESRPMMISGDLNSKRVSGRKYHHKHQARPIQSQFAIKQKEENKYIGDTSGENTATKTNPAQTSVPNKEMEGNSQESLNRDIKVVNFQNVQPTTGRTTTSSSFEGNESTSSLVTESPMTIAVTHLTSATAVNIKPTASSGTSGLVMNEGNEIVAGNSLPGYDMNINASETNTLPNAGQDTNTSAKDTSSSLVNMDHDEVVTGHTFVRFENAPSSDNATNVTTMSKTGDNSSIMQNTSESSHALNASAYNVSSLSTLPSTNNFLPSRTNSSSTTTNITKSFLVTNGGNLSASFGKETQKNESNTFEQKDNDELQTHFNGTVDEDRKGNETIDFESEVGSNRTLDIPSNNTANETLASPIAPNNTSSILPNSSTAASMPQNAINGTNNITMLASNKTDNKLTVFSKSSNQTEVIVRNVSTIQSSNKTDFKSRSEYHQAYGHAWNFSDIPDEEMVKKRKAMRKENGGAIEGPSLTKLNHSLTLMADGDTSVNQTMATNGNVTNKNATNVNTTSQGVNTSISNNTDQSQKDMASIGASNGVNQTTANSTMVDLNSDTMGAGKVKVIMRKFSNGKQNKHSKQRGGKSQHKSEKDNANFLIDGDKRPMAYPESEEALMSEDAMVRNSKSNAKYTDKGPAELSSTTILFSKSQKGNAEGKEKAKEAGSEEHHVVANMVNPVAIDTKIKGTPTAKQAILGFPTTEVPLPTAVNPLLTTISLTPHTHPSIRPYIPGLITKKEAPSVKHPSQIKIKFNGTGPSKTPSKADANDKDLSGKTIATTSFDLSKILPHNIDTGKYFISHIGGNEFVLTLKSDKNVIEESEASGDHKDSSGTVRETEDIQDALTRENIERGTEKGKRRTVWGSKSMMPTHKTSARSRSLLKEIVIRETTDDDARLYKLFLNVIPKYRLKAEKILPENYTDTEIYKRTKTEHIRGLVNEDDDDDKISIRRIKPATHDGREHRSKVFKQTETGSKRVLSDEEDDYDYSFDDNNPENMTQDDMLPSIIEDSYDDQEGSGVMQNTTEAKNQTEVMKNQTEIVKNQTIASSNTSANVTSVRKVINESQAKAAVKNESCNKPVKVLYVVDVSDGLGLGPTREKRWKRLRDFIQDVNVEILDDSTLGYVVYDVEPRFLRTLSPCDEATEYFVTSNPCLCEHKDTTARDSISACSTITPTKEESIEDFGVLGPRTGKAIEKARHLLKQSTSPEEKKLIVLITHKMAADDVDAAERTLRSDGVSLIDIEIGNRKEYYGRQKSTIYKRALNLQAKEDYLLPEDHKLQVSFQGLQRALSNIFYKICASTTEGKNIIERRFRIYKHKP